MFEEKIRSFLKNLNQEHLAVGLNALSLQEQEAFLNELQKYAPVLPREQKLLNNPELKSSSFAPLTEFSLSDKSEEESKGIQLISAGKMGCLILAGGQATRLGIDYPKGAFAVSLVKKKSLFQIFAEKTKAASVRAGRDLSLAIMTSPLNHDATVDYFIENEWFGLSKEQVDIFSQEMLPFIDDNKNWLLEKAGCLAKGPDGNGNSLLRFYQDGVFEKWQKKGVEFVNVVLIDNPLADPFDAKLCGFQEKSGADITVKATWRKDEEEKVGVLGKEGDKLKVVEYFELSPEEKKARDQEGSLRWKIASISLFCFRMDFIEKKAKAGISLPWHAARKEAAIFSQGRVDKVKVNKVETFIFDWLDVSNNSQVLVYPREECYAPLKNSQGESSLATVQDALLARDREIYSKVTGTMPPERKFELDPAFYYPTEKLLEKWKGKSLPQKDYIDAIL